MYTTYTKYITSSDDYHQVLCHKRFYPYCGSEDIKHKEIVVFGNVGAIDEATCNKCKGKF